MYRTASSWVGNLMIQTIPTNNYLTSRELADSNLAKLELNCYPITCPEYTGSEFSIRWRLTLEGEKFQLRSS